MWRVVWPLGPPFIGKNRVHGELGLGGDGRGCWVLVGQWGWCSSWPGGVREAEGLLEEPCTARMLTFLHFGQNKKKRERWVLEMARVVAIGQRGW